MLRCSLSSAKIQKKSKQQFHLIPFFYFPPKDCPSGGATIPTRLCRLPEQELQQQSNRAPTLQFSHRLHRTHSGWRRISSHRLHGYAQIRRVWHPCHTHAATKLSSHRIHGTQKRQVERLSHRLHRLTQMFRVVCCSVGVLSGGAAVSAAPTKQTCTNITILPQIAQNPPWLAENILPQIARICTD